MNKTDNISCTHLEQVDQNINAKTPNGCEECLQIGSHWVALRLCLRLWSCRLLRFFS